MSNVNFIKNFKLIFKLAGYYKAKKPLFLTAVLGDFIARVYLNDATTFKRSKVDITTSQFSLT